MKVVDPTREAISRFAQAMPADEPLVMLNLLRFRAEAAYPAGSEHPPCSGQEAYRRYLNVAAGKVAEAGGSIEWKGTARAEVIAPPDEHWHEVLLVRYPSAAAFLGMLKDLEYQASTIHRTAALEDARLIALSPGT